MPIENEPTVKAIESRKFIAVEQRQFSCKIGVELAYKKTTNTLMCVHISKSVHVH